MKNIHVLPTDKPSRLTKINDELFFGKNEREMLSEPSLNIAAQHLYIISDEEIKEGDWGLSKLNEVILFGRSYNEKFYKKIILTTDPDLIVMGNITPLDDDFLNWFVKNPTVEYVTVERLEDGQFVDYLSTGKAVEGVYENYKVIIPEEEPKQETLNKTNNMTAVEQVIFDLFDGNPPQWAKLIIKEGLEKEKKQMIAFAEYTSIIDQEKSDMKEVLDFYLTLGEEIVEDETPNEQIEINQEEPKQETLEEVDEKNLKNKNK